MTPLNKLFARMPTGKNSVKSTIRLYNEKQFYYDKVYPTENLSWLEKPFDFINENPLYGKVNLNGDYIIPKYTLVDGVTRYERIVEVNTDLFGTRAFDFVVEGFNDLKANIKSLVRLGHLSQDGPIAKFEAKKGFIDFGRIDKTQKNMHYFMFVSTFLSTPSAINGKHKYKELLHNSSDFINFYLLYLKRYTQEIPYTKSGIINSFYMSPRATGLCLEIDDAPYDDDQKKYAFLTDPNFNVYRILARRFGFMVDRNVPWRLVADVRSFKMREYMRLAYERKTILELQSSITRQAAKEIQVVFPELPTLEDLYMQKNGNGPYVLNVDYLKDVSWISSDELIAIEKNTKGQLADALKTVADQTKALGFSEIVEMYAAKDPKNNDNAYVDEDGTYIPATLACDGDVIKVCHSRILKFDKFFELYYDVPYSNEIKEIKKTFYSNYLSYYVQNPKAQKKVMCSDEQTLENKFIVQEINLELPNENQYNKLYSDYYWLKIYFDIKLAENNIKLKSDLYHLHLKKIMDLSTMITGNQNSLSGMTSKDVGHIHEYTIDTDGNGVAQLAVNPTNSSIKHEHQIINWVVQPAQSECYPGCIEGAPMHIHEINNNTSLALSYINKLVRKKMKGLKQIYGAKGQKKEQLIGQMLTVATQEGMISY